MSLIAEIDTLEIVLGYGRYSSRLQERVHLDGGRETRKRKRGECQSGSGVFFDVESVRQVCLASRIS